MPVEGQMKKGQYVGIKDRKTKYIREKVVEDTTKPMMQDFINETHSKDALYSQTSTLDTRA